jgi:predicted ArsR family transcriptional regulator
MEGSILELLEQHGSLAYEQIAAHLGAPQDAIRNALQSLRERALVEVLGLTQWSDDPRTAVAYWRLTDEGRGELARRRTASDL